MQAQLRYFIPEMLKYSTGKSKPGWGKPECRPTWWPLDVPWANVRSDVRNEGAKREVRTITSFLGATFDNLLFDYHSLCT